MPSIDENQSNWNDSYHWKQAGEEWSGPWGDSFVQWHGMILPRIRWFLPARTIVEIAPGFGRWTHYLQSQCESLVAVDLSSRCVDTCRERFAGVGHLSFYTNDGRSLPMVDDASVDFVFSFDSLVHVDRTTMQSYVAEIKRVLKPDGVAFLHHSNAAELQRRHAIEARVARVSLAQRVLARTGVVEELAKHWRDPTMSADVMAALARDAGLACVSQELVTWRTKRALIDCFTVVAPAGSKWAGPTRRLENRAFMSEAQTLRRTFKLYPRPT